MATIQASATLQSTFFTRLCPWALYTMRDGAARLLGRYRTEADAVDALLRLSDDDQVDAWVEEVDQP